MLKKIASIFTGVTVICWLSGLALLVPLPVHAVINEGDLIRGPDGIKVYIVNADGYKRHIYNPDVFDMYGHFTWESIQEVDQATLDSYTTSDLYRVDVEHQVYSVGEDGIKHWLNMTAAEFVTEGYSWNQVFIVNAVEGAYYTVGSELTPAAAVAGGLTVALADDTSVASQIPVSTTNVPFTSFNFTAGSEGDVSITALTIKRSGLASSPSSDFDNVKLFDGATQVGESRSVNSTTDLVAFNIASTPIEISAGATKKIDVKCDIASGATDDNISAFGINASTDITTDAATVSGTFPVTGNVMTVNTAVTVATVTVTKQGSDVTVYLGNEAATLGKFRLTVTSQENVEVRSLKLTQGGSADSTDISNIKLYQGTTLLSEVAVMEAGNTVVFDLTDSPFAITKGLSKDFEITADIVGGYNRTVIFYFDEAADLSVVGAKYGFGNTITLTSFSSSSYDTYAISGGALNFTLASDTPATGKVSVGATNFTFAKFNFVTGDEAVLIKNIPMTLAVLGTPVTDGVSNIRMSDGTTSYSATDPTLGTTAGAKAFYFPDDFTIPANTTLGMSIIGDVSASATATSYQFKLLTTAGSASTALYAKGVTSSKALADADIVPSAGTISARVMTRQASSITVTLAATPASRNVVRGVSDEEIAGFNLKAGDASAIKITKLIIYPYQSTDDSTYTAEDGTNLQNSTLYYGTTKLGATKNIVSSAITFDGFELTIPAGSTKKVVVKGNVPSSSSTTYLKMGITNASTNITAADDSGSTPSTVTISGATNGGLTAAATSRLYLRANDTLAVAVSADAPNAAIVVAGTSGVEFSKFKLSATNEYEPVLLTKFTVQATITASSTVSDVYLYDGTTELSGPISLDANDRADFPGLNLEIPKTSYKTLTVKADVSLIGEGATSADTVKFEFYSAEADGKWSGGEADNSSATTASNTLIVRKTVPTINLNAVSPSGAKAPGLNEVMRFDVTANAAGDVILDILTFAMSATDSNTATWYYATTTKIVKADFTLYDADDLNTALDTADSDWTMLASDWLATVAVGAGTQVYGVRIDLPTLETIAAGTTKTYALYFDSSGAGAGTANDFVQFTLKGDSAGNAFGGVGTEMMSWSDDGVGTADIDGGYVKNLDVVGGTLTH